MGKTSLTRHENCHQGVGEGLNEGVGVTTIGVGVGGTGRRGTADRMVPATMLMATTRPTTQKIIRCLRCFCVCRRFRAKSSSKRNYTTTLILAQILTSRAHLIYD